MYVALSEGTLQPGDGYAFMMETFLTYTKELIDNPVAEGALVVAGVAAVAAATLNPVLAGAGVTAIAH